MKKALFLILTLLANISFAENSNIETCFSPEGKCDQKLIAMINSAKKTLDIAIYSIDHPEIALAIIKAKNRGVVVRMVVDKSQSMKKNSQTRILSKDQIPLKIGTPKGIMHNKYSIIDGVILETGSFNYKLNSTNDNNENQIYISDKNVIIKYQENFEKIWNNGKLFQ